MFFSSVRISMAGIFFAVSPGMLVEEATCSHFIFILKKNAGERGVSEVVLFAPLLISILPLELNAMCHVFFSRRLTCKCTLRG